MTMDAASWNQRYVDGQTGWDRGETHPAMLRWLDDDVMKTGSIIVPGCGRGYEVVELAQRGFEVSAIDFAPEPIAHLKKQLDGVEGNVQTIQQDMLNYQPSTPVDAVYEQTCLCAIEPELRLPYEQAVYRWLKPGGKFFVLFAQKADNLDVGPPFHCSLSAMKELFPESRWQWPVGELSVFAHDTVPIQESAAVLIRK